MDEQITSMMANDTYIRARALTSQQARAKNWRRLLAFPNIHACDVLERRLDEVRAAAVSSRG